jgi:MFS family permease
VEELLFKTEMAIGVPFLAHLRLVVSQSHITPQVLEHQYSGSGTEEDPYIVEFLHNDPRNPRNFSTSGKWSITILVAIATLGVTFDSSAYTGGIRQIIGQFGVSQEVATLGVSLFVLGFAIGPLLWAPLSELYGRQIVFTATYGVLTILCAGAAGSQNIQTLIALRAFAGAFGSSPLTNAGGVISYLFTTEQRGLATAFFAAAPFLGPTLGPIVGGFLGETKGWRWIMGLMAIFTGATWILCTIVVPETYPPVLLSMRAKKLSKITGRIYKSRLEFDMKQSTVSQVFQTALARPWALLLREPIVLLLSIYMAISLYLPILEHLLAGIFDCSLTDHPI